MPCHTARFPLQTGRVTSLSDTPVRVVAGHRGMRDTRPRAKRLETGRNPALAQRATSSVRVSSSSTITTTVTSTVTGTSNSTYRTTLTVAAAARLPSTTILFAPCYPSPNPWSQTTAIPTTLLPSPSPSSSPSSNTNLPTSCTCTERMPGGFYCGYCSQVTSCVRGAECWSSAFLCGSGVQCGDYRALAYCEVTAEERQEKENCPFLSVRFGKDN
ncbi:hypothetical protein PSPO01_14052 [Paraphaeosphaeria sporulosa]